MKHLAILALSVIGFCGFTPSEASAVEVIVSTGHHYHGHRHWVRGHWSWRHHHHVFIPGHWANWY